jgi:hypothetical protein
LMEVGIQLDESMGKCIMVGKRYSCLFGSVYESELKPP